MTSVVEVDSIIGSGAVSGVEVDSIVGSGVTIGVDVADSNPGVDVVGSPSEVEVAS